jgi:calcineurin-like phosphoesterase family protein
VDARKIKEVAVNFAYHYYPINNTVLSEALSKIDRPNATVYIIGDFNLGDWKFVERQLPRLAGLNVLLVLLLVGNELHVRMMAEMAKEAGVKVRAYSVDTPKAMLENALRELKI